MKKKLFVAIYVTGIVIAVLLLNVAVMTIRKNPSTPISAEEMADISLSQYDERANANREIANSRIPLFLFPFMNALSARAEGLYNGCALRLSFTAEQKTVVPGGLVNYRIIFSNKGNEACNNVSLSVYYTDKEQFATSTPNPTASDYYWAIGNLQPNKTEKIILTTMSSYKNGEIMITESCATADNSSDVCSENIVFVGNDTSPGQKLSSAIQIPKIFGSVWGRNFSQKEFGIWVWDSVIKMNPGYAEEVLKASKNNGFNVIYLTVDDYIPITVIKGENQKREKDAYMKALNVFIKGANSSGISVDVVGGAKDWAIPKNRWKGYALIDFINEYNTLYPNNKIRNLQYDVEPYLLQEYESNKKKVLKEYIEFIDESARRMKVSSSGFTVVIPHFYDSTQKWTPSFAYKGTTNHAFSHLLKVLSQKENTSVIIMSYRNFFDGENGTGQISEAEIKEASEGDYSTKIIVAQETGNVPPDYVTFYDYPKVSLYDALNEIQEYFSSYKSFGGTAVHYFDSFMKLE